MLPRQYPGLDDFYRGQTDMTCVYQVEVTLFIIFPKG